MLKNGVLDLIAYGKSFIANPDFVARMRNGWLSVRVCFSVSARSR